MWFWGQVGNCLPLFRSIPILKINIMKIKLLKGIGIEGRFPKIGEVVEVADRLGRELIHREAAELSAVKEKPPVETPNEKPKKAEIAK